MKKYKKKEKKKEINTTGVVAAVGVYISVLKVYSLRLCAMNPPNAQMR
jgi:hypothetical protein